MDNVEKREHPYWVKECPQWIKDCVANKRKIDAEIRTIIAEMLSDIEALKIERRVRGLCKILRDCRAYKERTYDIYLEGHMKYAAERRGLVRSDRVYWFDTVSDQCTVEEWYAPRIEFLNDWVKQYEDKTLNTEQNG